VGTGRTRRSTGTRFRCARQVQRHRARFSHYRGGWVLYSLYRTGKSRRTGAKDWCRLEVSKKRRNPARSFLSRAIAALRVPGKYVSKMERQSLSAKRQGVVYRSRLSLSSGGLELARPSPAWGGPSSGERRDSSQTTTWFRTRLRVGNLRSTGGQLA